MYGYFWQDWFPFFNGNVALGMWKTDKGEQQLIDDYFWWQERNEIPPAYRVFYIGYIWRS